MADPSRSRLGLAGAAFLCAALVLFVQGAFFAVARAQTPTTTTLTGQLQNGTAGVTRASVANLPVTLFQMGGAAPVTRTVQTDDRGQFVFSDVVAGSTAPLFVQLKYAGIEYFSDVIQPSITTTNPISITVYETETLPADFAIDQAHLILDAVPKELQGVEFLQLTNLSDRAFLMPLPVVVNAESVQFEDPRDEIRAVRQPDGSILFPVLPGDNQVLFGVGITVQPPNHTLQFATPVKLARLNVLANKKDGVQAASGQLAAGADFSPPADPANPSQAPPVYAQLTGSNIPANTTVSVALSNLPGADNNSNQVQTVAVLGAGGLAAIVLIVIPLIRRRRGEASQARRESGVQDAAQEDEEGLAESDRRLARLQAIADLDDLYEEGRIDEAVYKSRRAELKAELMEDEADN